MRRRRSWPPVAVALAASGACLAPAAADTTLSGFFSQQLQARDGGSEDGDAAALRSTTDLGVTLRGASPRASWTVSPGVRATLSTDDDEDARLTPRFGGGFSVGGARTTLTGSLSVTPDFVDEAQFDDTGAASRDALQISTSASVGLSHALDPRNSVTLGLTGFSRDFVGDAGDLSSTRSVGVNTSWRRGLSPLTTATASPSLRLFVSEDDNGSDGATLSLPLGLDTRLTPSTTLTASLGPSITRSRRDGESDRTDLGVVGGLTLSWRDADNTAVFGLNQFVDQDADGALENRTTLRVGVGRQLTRAARVSLDANAGLQTALDSADGRDGGDRRTFSISPGYSYDLSEDWTLNLSYRLRASDDDDGSDVSNAVFLRLSTGLSLLP